MSEAKGMRLAKVAKELNVGLSTIVEFLGKQGYAIESNPNTKIDETQYSLLLKEFQGEKLVKEKSKSLETFSTKRETVTIEEKHKEEKRASEELPNEVLIKDTTLKVEPIEEVVKPKVESPELKVLGKIELPEKKKGKSKPKEEPAKKEETPPVAAEEKPAAKSMKKPVQEEEPTTEPVTPTIEESIPETELPKEEEVIRAQVEKLEGPKIIGKIELPKETPKASLSDLHKEHVKKEKKKRQRIKPDAVKKVDPTIIQGANFKKEDKFKGNKNKGGKDKKVELSEEDIQKQVKETLARLSERTKSKQVKLRKQKREEIREKLEEEAIRAEEDRKILKVTEFVSANQLAQMMDVPVTEVISACMSLGLFVSINQRLDAETISIIAEEFGYNVNFVTADIQEAIEEEEDDPNDLTERPPVVTVMGHVDHGKTSLLDYIRKSNVIAGEAGGITQHIGAYGVELENGKHITFIDTPGHEAFTAMRARGAQVTDVAIIVIAADDSVMPQTVEAINHAKAAGVPIVFAINKVDKPGANPDKIREALAAMNYLVEEWGGKYQCQEISAKFGKNIDILLDKVLLEAEMLQLKANPKKRASGTVIEAQLDKGRGFVTTVLVQNGTLHVGDVILAGPYSGRVKAMFNERGVKIDSAGPSTPVRVLGLTGAPQAGDKFNVMEDEREAREIAAKRLQLQREQGLRAKKHITLDEIGRRIAIGDFKQLNILIKGDTDGSIEALGDALLKLSTEKIQVNIIHKAVGAISESDVLLASASDAIIVGFNVRPSTNARKLAEKEEIDIRHYSIIYQAIEEVKAAMEGMLAPEFEEKVIGNAEIREVFHITKVGAVAGCYITDGKVTRNSKVRIIRDGIVIHTGKLSSLKRFKDDVKEVTYGYECGMSFEKFDAIQPGDVVEAFEEVQVKPKL
ncbi:MAG: translation initiation factor IF-2 [Flavobacteriales bacterium]|nr:translation initiation factor IF-2 [Flavobacteriales bacterium]